MPISIVSSCTMYLIHFYNSSAAKEAKKSTRATTKKPAAAGKTKPAPKQKIAKVIQKAAPRVGGKR